MPSKEDLWRWCWIKQHFQRSDRVRSFEPLPRPLRVNLPESLVFGLSKVFTMDHMCFVLLCGGVLHLTCQLPISP